MTMPVSILEKKAVRSQAMPISVELYHELGRTGKISEKTELLEGAVIEKMPKDPLHASVVTRMATHLLRELENRFIIRQENPLTFSDSEPEPDLAVVDRRDDWYRGAHPSLAHLVVEVSNTTLDLDREKAFVYAKAGIPEYWIVNIKDMTVEVHTGPGPAGYGSKTIFGKNEAIVPGFLSGLRFILAEFVE